MNSMHHSRLLLISVQLCAHDRPYVGTLSQEGPSHDRGLYYRAFEELFDLVNAENSPSSRTAYYVTMFELHNEQVGQLIATVSFGVLVVNKIFFWSHLAT